MEQAAVLKDSKSDVRVSVFFESAACTIRRMPVVDAEPVRRGTWETRRATLNTGFATMTGTYPTCSLCGYVEFGVDKSTPYCPGCGAKMDGRINEAALLEAAAKARLEKPAAPDTNRITRYFEGAKMGGDG